jgi:methionyl-tRNA formyltransferase
MNAPDWWRKPRRVMVVVDNDSWVLPYAEQLIEHAQGAGDDAVLCRRHDDIDEGAVAFYLGCVKITPPDVLARNQRNLVVHASDLPQGRGFSPLTWQILEGKSTIPICLLDAVEGVDAGTIVYRDSMHFNGHELIEEMRGVMGLKHVELCLRFLADATPPIGREQTGEASVYQRRRPADSALDPNLTIAEQFNLLRVVDNRSYPAFFDLNGHRYRLSVEKIED